MQWLRSLRFSGSKTRSSKNFQVTKALKLHKWLKRQRGLDLAARTNSKKIRRCLMMILEQKELIGSIILMQRIWRTLMTHSGITKSKERDPLLILMKTQNLAVIHLSKTISNSWILRSEIVLQCSNKILETQTLLLLLVAMPLCLIRLNHSLKNTLLRLFTPPA